MQIDQDFQVLKASNPGIYIGTSDTVGLRVYFDGTLGFFDKPMYL